jgi:hypothetical protein
MGDWSFDALCTHFARRATGMGVDHFAKWRKRVVVAGWVEDCLEQKKLLEEGRYSLWEIM